MSRSLRRVARWSTSKWWHDGQPNRTLAGGWGSGRRRRHGMLHASYKTERMIREFDAILEMPILEMPNVRSDSSR